MVIEPTIIALFVPLIVALVAGGIWVGKISERVGNNRYDITGLGNSFREYQKSNQAEHMTIIARLDKILTNGLKDK